MNTGFTPPWFSHALNHGAGPVQTAGAGSSLIFALCDFPVVLTQVTETNVPGGLPLTITVSASGEETRRPSAAVITSPAPIPAFAAPVPHSTPTTSAPELTWATERGLPT